MVAHALVWGAGGALAGAAARAAFDARARRVLDGVANYPAEGGGTVFDYRLDVARCAVFGCGGDGVFGAQIHSAGRGGGGWKREARGFWLPGRSSSPHLPLTQKTLENSATFVKWEDALPPFTYNPATPFHSLLVPTPESACCGALLRACLEARAPALVVGGVGSGKTAIVNAQLAEMVAASAAAAAGGQRSGGGAHSVTRFSCSAFISSGEMQALLTSRLARRAGRLVPPQQQRGVAAGAGTAAAPAAAGPMPPPPRTLIFVDDLNLAAAEPFGAQPPLEALRLLLDRGGVFDRRTLAWWRVDGAAVAAAAAPPGGGHQPVPARLARHFVQLALPAPGEGAVARICTAVLGGFLAANFTPDVTSRALAPMAAASAQLFAAAAAALLPAPGRAHYGVGLRHVARALQGVCRVRAAQCGANVRGALARLWAHEHLRVYGDGLADAEGAAWLREQLAAALRAKFGWRAADCDALLAEEAQVVFGDCLRLGVPPAERAYEELPAGGAELVALLKAHQEEMQIAAEAAACRSTAAAAAAAEGGEGASAGFGAPVQAERLVLFRDAAHHVLRLARIFGQPG